MEYTILHCDMNNFFASVACAETPSLRGKPIAVCGDAEARHGIVLAKNDLAKSYGIQTGEPIFRANAKCRDLVIVPAHYDTYLQYSAAARKIYENYTDRIEPMGIDEVWLDVTGSRRLFGGGIEIADTLRRRIKESLGVTISVGVSFNKVFAKLGSDMKKPDAVTVITKENFKQTVWPRPVSELLGVGRSVDATLKSCGIFTIGQLAGAYPPQLINKLGKNAFWLIEAAGGRNHDPVLPGDAVLPVKSIGHGTTTYRDMENESEVFSVMLSLCEEIGHRLHICGKRAGGIMVTVRNNQLKHRQYQTKLSIPTDSQALLAEESFLLFRRKHRFDLPLRSVTVTAIDLHEKNEPCQMNLFTDTAALERHETIDRVMDELRIRFGERAVRYGVLYNNPLTDKRENIGFGQTGTSHNAGHPVFCFSQ